jgi:hypothetical protein
MAHANAADRGNRLRVQQLVIWDRVEIDTTSKRSRVLGHQGSCQGRERAMATLAGNESPVKKEQETNNLEIQCPAQHQSGVVSALLEV